MKFSQRIGKTSIKSILQVESIDDDLKNRLWNVILEYFFLKFNSYSSYGDISEREEIYFIIWKEFFKQTVDTRPSEGFDRYFRNWFFYQAKWYEIYDFLEFITKLEYIRHGQFTQIFKNACNFALEKELSGYRIIGENISKITEDEEVKAIEEALVNTDKWKPITVHLKTALDYFADRKTPDYRNSIKESISAVEAFCRIILNNDKATLGEALSMIEKTYGLHGALKSAFSALYGYTSDSGGIRHSMTGKDIIVNFDDAKFMLVSCSAFINYLKAKMKI